MGVGGVLLGPPCDSHGMLLMMIKGECACWCGRHGIPKHDHDQSTCPCSLHGTCCCSSPKPVTWGGLGGMHCECRGGEAEKIRRHEGGEPRHALLSLVVGKGGPRTLACPQPSKR